MLEFGSTFATLQRFYVKILNCDYRLTFIQRKTQDVWADMRKVTKVSKAKRKVGKIVSSKVRRGKW
jgi:hypothetical protein